MSSQHEMWSKDRLKSELKRKGIPHSPNKTKDYYVKIYQDSVLGGRSPMRLRSELSSDEEFVSKRLSSQQQRRQYTKVLNVEHFTRQVSDYSDSHLYSELKKHGIDAGPITASTRGLYQKRLAKAMFDKVKKEPISQSSSGVTVASESDNELSSDYEKDEVDIAQKPTPYTKQTTTYHRQTQKSEVIIPASAYNFRPRPSAATSKPPQKPVDVKSQKPVLVPRGDDTPRPHPITTPPSTAPVRPYSATWCHVRLFVNLFILLAVFMIAVIGFDYMLYGSSRVIDWLIERYPALSNITPKYFS